MSQQLQITKKVKQRTPYPNENIRGNRKLVNNTYGQLQYEENECTMEDTMADIKSIMPSNGEEKAISKELYQDKYQQPL